MRRIVARAVIAIIIALVSSIGAFLAAPKRMQPLARDAVAQVWVGLSEDELYMFRLDLAQDGTGFGAFVFADEPPQTFRVTWQYEPGRISVAAMPTRAGPGNISKLSGTLRGIAMQLVVSGEGWKRSVALRPEMGLEQRWLKLRTASYGAGIQH